ncbi:MAG: glycosyltransferase [Fusobacteriaceae bacterium]
MRELRLSVIIPMYNNEKHIVRCLESLNDQDILKEEYEMIVIDDGSKDRSLECAQKFSENYKNIKIISQKNGGCSVARNRGLDEARGKYIWFLDADDYAVQNRLGTILEKMESNDLDILSFVSEDTEKLERIRWEKEEKADIGKIYTGIEYIENFRYSNMIWDCTFRREFLEKTKVKFIEGRFSQDSMFKVDVLTQASRVAYMPLMSHFYYINTESAVHNKEKSHYEKMIKDYMFVADFFSKFIEEIKKEKKDISDKYIKRVQTRKESFVFFLLVRLVKSELAHSDVIDSYRILKQKGYIPIENFVGIDYSEGKYKVLTYIFNREKVFDLSVKLFKMKNKILFQRKE